MSRRRIILLLFGSNILSILADLKLRSTYYENATCTTAILTELENIE